MSATVKRQQGLSDLACCVAILIESSETSNTQLARSGLGTLFLGFRTSFASIRNCTVTPCHGGRTHVTRWRARRGDKEKRTRGISGRARRGRGAARLCPTQLSRPPQPHPPRCSTPRPVAGFIGQLGIAADRSSSAPCVCALPARTSAAARAASQCTGFCGPPHPSREREPAQAARAGLYDMSEGSTLSAACALLHSRKGVQKWQAFSCLSHLG